MALQRFNASSSSSFDVQNDSSESSESSASERSPPSKKLKHEVQARNLSWNHLQSLEVDDPSNFVQLIVQVFLPTCLMFLFD